jgi:hypothetical protein
VRTADFRRIIQENAAEIVRLKERIDETLRHRDDSPSSRALWERACSDFHARFNELSFPGGYDGARDRLVAGDLSTIEAALCFLELRPFFFRSGYIRTALLRKIKRAPLSAAQAGRLQALLERQAHWKAAKHA